MATKKQNFCIFQGDDVVLSVTTTTIEDGDDPQDLTGVSLTWAFSETKDSVALVTKETGDGIEITDAAGGVFEVSIDAADTDGLDPQGYYHEARLTDGAGKTRVIMSGAFTLHSSVTG
jgi:hypothetical protein